MAEYAERDIRALDRQGNYYSRHISAMTVEKLHDKSDIAAELAWRDARIDELATHVERLRDDLQWVWDHVNLGGRAHDRVRGALDSTPKASLARRDALKQAEALEHVVHDSAQCLARETEDGDALLVDDLHVVIDELRRQAEKMK